jgi:hypothetical protein
LRNCHFFSIDETGFQGDDREGTGRPARSRRHKLNYLFFLEAMQENIVFADAENGENGENARKPSESTIPARSSDRKMQRGYLGERA